MGILRGIYLEIGRRLVRRNLLPSAALILEASPIEELEQLRNCLSMYCPDELGPTGRGAILKADGAPWMSQSGFVNTVSQALRSLDELVFNITPAD